MIYNFNSIPNRRAGESVKWRAYPADVLPLWVADMDFPSPQPIVDALQQRVAESLFGYPHPEVAGENQPRLSEIIVERLARRYAWQIQPEDVVLLPGVVPALHLAAQALAAPQGQVLIQTPVYPPFLDLARYAEQQPADAPLQQDDRGTYQVDFTAFNRALNPNTRLFVLCNPHNPVGRVFQSGELAQIAEACLRHNVVICSDEIHCDLLFDGRKHIPIASLAPEVAQNTITLMAPSKTFNIAGLNCAFAVIQNPSLRRIFNHARRGLLGGVNALGLIAASAAYAHGQEWLDQMLPYLQANRDFLLGFIQQEMPQIRVNPPEGTYLAWLDCRALNLPGGPYKFFLEQAKVALNDGDTFGPGGAGFVRLNFACPRPLLEQALRQIRAALP